MIDREVREKLGVKPGWIAVWRGAEVYFFPPPHRRSLKGRLRDLVKARVPPERWDEARKAAAKE